jgi:hypothetical protein
MLSITRMSFPYRIATDWKPFRERFSLLSDQGILVFSCAHQIMLHARQRLEDTAA